MASFATSLFALAVILRRISGQCIKDAPPNLRCWMWPRELC